MRRLLTGITIFLIFLSLFLISTPTPTMSPVKAAPMAWHKPFFVNITNSETGELIDLSVTGIHIERYKNVTIMYSVQDGEDNDTAVEMMGSGSEGLNWDVGDGPFYAVFVSQDAENVSYYAYELNVTATITNFKANVNPLGNEGWEDGANHVIYATGAVIWQSFAALTDGTMVSYGDMNGAVAPESSIQFVINASVAAGTENFLFGYQVLHWNSTTGSIDYPQAWSTPAAVYNATWATLDDSESSLYWTYDVPAAVTATEGYIIEFKGIYDENNDGEAQGPEYEPGLPANRLIHVDMNPPTITETGPTETTFDIGDTITLGATINDPLGIFINGTIKIGAAAATTINMTELIDADGKFSYDIPTTGLSAGSLSVVLTVYDTERYFIGGDAHIRKFHEATHTWTFTLETPETTTTTPTTPTSTTAEEDGLIPAFLLPLVFIGLIISVILRRKK